MVVALLVLPLVYLVGALPMGYLVARIAGVNIRHHGSGNIGATNVLRTLGRTAGAITLLLDVAKGYLAAALALALGPEAWGGSLGAILAVVGNCWSVFLGFRGGKGMATGLGAFLCLMPLAVVPALGIWVVVTAISRYVSLGSVTAALCAPLAALVLQYPPSAVASAAVVALIIVFRHRENLGRMRSGTERRLGERVSAS